MVKKTKARSKAKKKNNKNNNLMIWVFVTLFLLIVMAIAVILTLNGRSNPNTDENFFLSDATKYVVPSDTISPNGDDDPIAAYDVYYHDGDKITAHKAYYEFVDRETAEGAFTNFKNIKDDDIDTVELDGKYIVLVAKPSQYQSFTLEMVKRWTETDEDGEIDDEAYEAENSDTAEGVDEAELAEGASD